MPNLQMLTVGRHAAKTLRHRIHAFTFRRLHSPWDHLSETWGASSMCDEEQAGQYTQALEGDYICGMYMQSTSGSVQLEVQTLTSVRYDRRLSSTA